MYIPLCCQSQPSSPLPLILSLPLPLSLSSHRVWLTFSIWISTFLLSCRLLLRKLHKNLSIFNRIIGMLKYIFSVCGVITRTWEFSLPKTTSWIRHCRISIVTVECEVKWCWFDVGLGKLWASQSERLQIYYLSIILLRNIEGQEISSYKIFLYSIFDFLYLCKREWCSSRLQAVTARRAPPLCWNYHSLNFPKLSSYR